MNRLVFKTTIEGSNPHIIRQFQLYDTASVQLLLQTVAVIHGWEKYRPLILTEHAAEVPEETLLSTVFLPKGSASERKFRIVGIMGLSEQKPELSKVLSGMTPCWNLRLELLEKVPYRDQKTVPEFYAPELLRFRGPQPLSDCISMQQNNRVLLELMRKQVVYSDWRRIIRAGDVAVDLREINRKLKQLTNPSIRDVRISHSAGDTLTHILNTHTVNELKYCLTDHHIPLSYQGRKNQVIGQMSAYYDRPEFWRSLLREMPYHEYLAFCEVARKGVLYYSGDTETTDFQTLNSYGLLGRHFQEVIVPDPLLGYYEEFLANEGDDLLLRDKQVRAAACICSRLYSVFDGKAAFEVYRKMFPEQEGEEYSPFLKELTAAGREGMLMFTKGGCFFDPLQISSGQAEQMGRKILKEHPSFYVPDSEEAMDILRRGLRYPAPVFSGLLEKIIRLRHRKSYYVSDERIIERSYRLFHQGADEEQVLKELVNTYYYGLDTSERSLLRELLAQAAPQVRVAGLQGYTRTEYLQNTGRRNVQS